MTKKNIIRPILILLLSTAFLAGCANQGHHGKKSGGHGNNNGGHSNSSGGHSNSSGGHGSSSEGGHGTTVIEDEAHPTPSH